MSDENSTANEPAAEGQQKPSQPQFGLQRIYVKDMSFESPISAALRATTKPQVSQDLNTVISKVGDNHYEVVLKLTITVKQEDGKVAFLVEVHQAGLFLVSGLDGAQLQHTLSSACPTILFPYAREAIDNMALRGGFPPLALPPINFDAVYAKAMNEVQAQQAAAAGAGESAPETH